MDGLAIAMLMLAGLGGDAVAERDESGAYSYSACGSMVTLMAQADGGRDAATRGRRGDPRTRSQPRQPDPRRRGGPCLRLASA